MLFLILPDVSDCDDPTDYMSEFQRVVKLTRYRDRNFEIDT